MTKYDENAAKAWELLTDAERAELMRSDAADWQDNEQTESHCSDSVLRLTCFILNIVTGFIGFVAGWWLV